MVPTVIKDPLSGNAATVTAFGQLVVAPVAYSAVIQSTLDTTDTAFNLLEPSQGQQIVITDIILTANREVGVNDATVELYLAIGPDELVFTPADAVLSLELEKNGKLALNGLNLITRAGAWINAKTNDATIFVTLMYYRVPVS